MLSNNRAIVNPWTTSAQTERKPHDFNDVGYAIHVWQSHVEIEYYFAYSITSLHSKRCISELQLRAGLKGSSEILHFECNDTIEIRNRRIYNFYTEMSRIYS